MITEEGRTKSTIWEVAHRPKTLSELVTYPALRKRLEMYVKEEDFPHICLHGGTGTGKTTIANILATSSETIEREFYECGKLDKKEVKKISSLSSNAPLYLFNKKRRCIIMDEFTDLGLGDQKKFGTTFEYENVGSRYILTTNEIGKVQPMIASRCQLIPTNICQVNEKNKLVFYDHTELTLNDWKEQLRNRGLQVLQKEVEWGRIERYDEGVIDKVLDDETCLEDVRTFIRTLGEQTKMYLMDN